MALGVKDFFYIKKYMYFNVDIVVCVYVEYTLNTWALKRDIEECSECLQSIWKLKPCHMTTFPVRPIPVLA